MSKKLYILFLLLVCMQVVVEAQTTVTIFADSAVGKSRSIKAFAATGLAIQDDSIVIRDLRGSMSGTNIFEHGYCVFDLAEAGIPAGATITSATIGYYVANAATSTLSSTDFYINAVAGDLSSNADEDIMNGIMKQNRLASSNSLYINSTGFGSSTGNQTLALNRNLSWLGQNAHGKISLVFTERSFIALAAHRTVIMGYRGNRTDTGAAYHRPYIKIAYTAPSTCSGSPAAGTAVATPQAGNAATFHVLSLYGAAISDGLTYQWQAATTETGTYTDISGATQRTYSFSRVTATKYYRCAVTCAGTTTYSTPTPIFLISNYACTSPIYLYIHYANYVMSSAYPMGCMTFNTTFTGDSGTVVVDSTIASPRSYNNLCNAPSAQGLIFFKGRRHVIELRHGENNLNWRAWIDYNNDGNFDSTELQGSETVATGGGLVSTVALSAIPNTVANGFYRMRVAAVFSTTSPVSCPTSYNYGNVRDYLVKITDGPSATAAPANLDFGLITTGSYSHVLNSNIRGQLLFPASGTLTVNGSSTFEVSPDSTSWATSCTISYSAGTFNNRVFVRFHPTGTTRAYTDTLYVTGGGLYTPLKIPLAGVGANACTGIPLAGIARVARVVTGSLVSYNLSLSGATFASELIYQWQSSPSGSIGTWSTITGATSPRHVFTTSTYGNAYFRCIVTCSTSGSSDTSSSILAAYALPASSCTPTTINSFASCVTTGMVLSKVRVTGAPGYGYLGDSVFCNTSGYNDRTSLRTTLFCGGTYTVHLTSGITFPLSTQWWIDFNNNGAFDSTEIVGGNTGFVDTCTVTLTIPLMVRGGIHRMRVFTSYASPAYPNIPPCGGHNFGGARDYSVDIMSGFRPDTIDFHYSLLDSLAVDSSVTFASSNLIPDSGYLRLSTNGFFGISLTSGVHRTVDSIFYRGGIVPPTRVYAYFRPRTAMLHHGRVQVVGGGIDSTIRLRMSGRGIFTRCTSGASAGTIRTTTPIADDTTAIIIYGVGCDTNGGIETQWQKSVNGTTWVNIPGATRDTLIHRGIMEKTFFRRKVLCYFTGTVSYSPALAVHYPHRILAYALTRTADCYEYQVTVRVNSGLPSMKIVTNYGDGISDTVMLSATTVFSWTHTYAMTGTYSIRFKLFKGDTLYDSRMISQVVNFCNTIKLRNFYDTDSNCVKSATEHMSIQTNRVKVDSAGYTVDTIAYLGALNYSAYGTIGDIYRFTPIEDPTHWRILCLGAGYFADTLRSGGYVHPIHYVPLLNRFSMFDYGMYTVGRFSRMRDGRVDLYPRLNFGEDTSLCIIKYRISPRMRISNTSHRPSIISMDSLEYSWHFNRFRYTTVELNLRSISGSFSVGDTLYSVAQVGPLMRDVDTPNNFGRRCDEVVAAYDPNFIASNPAGCITSGITTEYTVGFENTGNDTAYNVHVLDTLSGYLDPRTLEPIMSSHPMVMETRHIGGMTIVKFDFPDIKLLDSSQPHGNHGVFKYKIRVRSGLADGTLISSRVGIYFDDNDVVMTNTQVNTINCPVYVTYPTVESVGTATAVDNLPGSNDLKVYPNPVNDELHIEATLAQYDECVVTNTMGKVIWSSKLHLAHQTIPTKQWPSGIYFVQVKGTLGTKTVKLVKQ